MSKVADEYEEIARRLKELEADRQLALTGSTIPEPKVEVPSVESVYGDYACGWIVNWERPVHEYEWSVDPIVK